MNNEHQINIKDSISYEVNSKCFLNDISVKDFTRYLKGIYSTVERLKDLELNTDDWDCFYLNDVKQEIVKLLPSSKPFSYKEAFELKNNEFRALCFGSVDIAEMIESLGSKRISTDGKDVHHKKYSKSGKFLKHEDYHVIYEVYEVDCSLLRPNVDDIFGTFNPYSYAVKCWCTTTDEEHWIWIDEKYKDKPLEAIASTFVCHKSVKPHITEIKRQGDILLVETDRKVDVPENDELVHFTADEYFSLLTAQS